MTKAEVPECDNNKQALELARLGVLVVIFKACALEGVC